MQSWNIIKSVTVCNGKVFINNKHEHSFDPEVGTITKELQKIYAKGYGKFFKMDKLSKLGFVSAEILLNGFEIKEEDLNEVALIIGNSSATTPTDLRYYESMSEIPSPAVFVYTLPNILIGEICIKNKFKGESLFFISKDFCPSELLMHVNTVASNTKIKHIVAGWINFENDKEYLSNIYLISQTEDYIKLNKENLEKSFTVHKNIT